MTGELNWGPLRKGAADNGFDVESGWGACYFHNMKTKELNDWALLGRRIAEARQAEGLSQDALGQALGLDRSAVSRIESGSRQLDSLELLKIGKRLGRPLPWFLDEGPTMVVSRRDAAATESVLREDRLLDELARNIRTLVELRLLSAGRQSRMPRTFMTVEDAEELADRVRKRLGLSGPIADLCRACEALGLLAFSLRWQAGAGGTGQRYAGAYALVSGIGVAAVDGDLQAARKRFALAHELCHHLLRDDSDSNVDVPVNRSERERLLDAFAIHFLMPRNSVASRWAKLLKEERDERGAAIVLGHEFGVNWSAVLGHLVNLGHIDANTRLRLVSDKPSAAELLERGLRANNDLAPPTIPAKYAQAVLKGYRKHKLSTNRAAEMLFGAIDETSFPARDEIPLESYESDREPL